MSRPTRRTFLAGTSALALAPLLTACGDDTGATGPAGRAAPAEESAFPATITHKFGETEVTAAPKRVAVVGLVEQDMLLALGIVPISTSNWFGDAPGRIFPWAVDTLGDADLPTVLDPNDAGFVEEVINLGPDLIVATYSGLTKKEYELFSAVCPTIAQAPDYADYGEPWQEATQRIGAAVGQPEAAQQLIDDVEGTIAAARAEHPEFEGKTAVCVTPYEGLFVYGPEDPRGRILQELGFTFPDALLEGATGEFGYSLSTERTADLAGLDCVVWLGLDIAPDGMTGLFESTDTFREGRYFDINEGSGDYYIGQSFVTPLSIPYVLERYVPQIAAAVDGDPGTEPPPSTE